MILIYVLLGLAGFAAYLKIGLVIAKVSYEVMEGERGGVWKWLLFPYSQAVYEGDSLNLLDSPLHPFISEERQYKILVAYIWPLKIAFNSLALLCISLLYVLKWLLLLPFSLLKSPMEKMGRITQKISSFFRRPTKESPSLRAMRDEIEALESALIKKRQALQEAMEWAEQNAMTPETAPVESLESKINAVIDSALKPRENNH